MARVIGQIESLKRLRVELDNRNIFNFNSVREINNFINKYESEKRNSKANAEKEINKQIEQIENQIKTNKKILQWKKEEITKTIEGKILNNKNKIARYKDETIKNTLKSVYYNSLIKILERENVKLIVEQKKEISEFSSKIKRNNQHDIDNLIDFEINKEKKILIRHKENLKELERIRNNLQELNYLIAGAIGENLVVKEIKKLSDDFILLNDFSLSIKPPIIYKKEPIFNIQIDHLLISTKGIFILETKNWSKKSIRDLDLRSPIEQIMRSNYVLFKLISEALQRNYINLNQHHWGEKNIKIRNIIVMINNKPSGNFKYVSIKSVNELNNYLNYLDAVFNSDEIEDIYKYLSSL